TRRHAAERAHDGARRLPAGVDRRRAVAETVGGAGPVLVLAVVVLVVVPEGGLPRRLLRPVVALGVGAAVPDLVSLRRRRLVGGRGLVLVILVVARLAAG